MRAPLLRNVGAALVAEDPVATADVIVMTVDARTAGVLEAADLVHAGISNRVALFSEQPDPADREMIRRGFTLEEQSRIQQRMFQFLGVSDVQMIPGSINGTSAEAELLADWCQSRHYHSIVVVTNSDHSRRMRRVLRRTMHGRGITVMVKPARLSPFEPDQWWRSRNALRGGIVELQKLALDVLRHPIS